MLIECARDRVRVLRAVNPAGDALSTRRSMERALATVDWRPRGFPSGAIVCVRRLRVAGEGMDGTRWTDQLQNRISGAARPFRDGAATDQPAVVFLDEAELLACLARDCQSGAVSAWWWTTLFGEPAGAALLRRVFLASAMFVPAAFALLAETRDVVRIVRGLPDAFCADLERAIALAFGIALSADVTASDRIDPASSAQPVQVCGRDVAAATTFLAALGASVGVLSWSQQSLLAVALLVRRAPELARRPRVLTDLHRRLADSTDDASVSASNARVEHAASPHLEEAVNVEGDTTLGAALDPERSASLDFDRASERPDSPADGEPSPEREPTPSPRAPAQSLDQDLGDANAEPWPTDFAGLFYLVNLAIYLDLYGDFTQPARQSPALPLWRFLARAGQHACGEAFREDPLWTALVTLADDGDVRGEGDAESIERAIDAVLPGLERPAALALGMPEGTAIPFLCAREGRVAIGRTRVEVFFQLESHPLSIRVAGLDRDPGWVPAAGRILAFHFD